MVSALEHAGAVELSMRSWRFISGRRRCAVDRLEGPRSRRHEVVVVSSCFGTAIGTMKRGSGRLGAPRRRRGAPLRLGGPICCIVSGKILGCKLRTNLRQVARRGSCWANCYIVLSDAEWEVYTTPPYRATAPLCFTTHRNGQRNGPTEAQWGPSAPPRRPEPRLIASTAVPKREDTTT